MYTSRVTRNLRARTLASLFLASVAGEATLATWGCASFRDGTAPAAPDGAAPEPDASEAGPRDADATAPGRGGCADLLARDPGLRGRSGRYTIDTDDAGALEVFCEMTVDEGGWTLVARSSTPSPQFGWTSPTGSLSDVSPPYVLDVARAHLAFTEVLVADRRPYEFTPASRAYKLAVPARFVEEFANAPFGATGKTVLGDCDVDGGPLALRYLGYTHLTDHLFFGNNPGTDTSTGLGPATFTTAASDCASGAGLNGLQGLVYVR